MGLALFSVLYDASFFVFASLPAGLHVQCHVHGRAAGLLSEQVDWLEATGHLPDDGAFSPCRDCHICVLCSDHLWHGGDDRGIKCDEEMDQHLGLAVNKQKSYFLLLL